MARVRGRYWRHAGVVLLGLALVEAGLRLDRFGWTPTALGEWRSAPPWERLRRLAPGGAPEPLPFGDAAWALAPGQPVVRYRLNGLGLRDRREPDPHPATGVCRILALGDAYTFGYGVREAATYPRRLERRLARGGRAEVVNGGFPNLDVVQQVPRAGALLARLHPDVLLLSFDWWNVPAAPGAAPRLPRWSARWMAANVEDRAAWLGQSVGLVDVGLRLTRDSLTPALFAPSGLARELEPLSRPPDMVAGRWEGAEAALRAIAGAARAGGARFALVVVPLDLQVDPSRRGLYRRDRLPYPAHGFADVDYASAGAMPAALRRFAADAGIPIIDLVPAFRARRGRGLFLAGDYHASPAGYAVIAREVARWIVATRACPSAR